MPKVKLGRDIRKERIEYRRNLIEAKAHGRGYRTQVQLAEAMHVSKNWLSRRVRGEVPMELDDIDKLDKCLRFDAVELSQLVRCR